MLQAASNSMYNVKNQPYYSGSSASMAVAVALNRGLSESSDQPECRFFMNTGTCKYGDDCKYSHPGVRISQPPPSLINPFVLPARPVSLLLNWKKSFGYKQMWSYRSLVKLLQRFWTSNELLFWFLLSRDNQPVVTSGLMDSASLDQTANSTTLCCHIRAWPWLLLCLLLLLHLLQPIRGSHQHQTALIQSLFLMVNLMWRKKAQRLRNQTMEKCRICLRMRHHHDHDS